MPLQKQVDPEDSKERLDTGHDSKPDRRAMPSTATRLHPGHGHGQQQKERHLTGDDNGPSGRADDSRKDGPCRTGQCPPERQFARDAVYPYGAGGPNASFAFLTAHYMRTYGATREDFGKLCVAQRENALQFPHALFKKPLRLDEYLRARPITEPLHLFDCVMPCAGAEGFLVMGEAAAKGLGLPWVRVLGTIERHNAFASDPIQLRGGWEMDRADLYAQAGLTPADIDLVETYDDYPVIALMQLEDLGFCAKGEGPQFVRSHSFTADGSLPVNTSGGQLSVGQAGAAGGYLGMVEAIRQLTGRPLGAAVKDAKIGLVSGFGMINYDRGLCSGAAIHHDRSIQVHREGLANLAACSGDPVLRMAIARNNKRP